MGGFQKKRCWAVEDDLKLTWELVGRRERTSRKGELTAVISFCNGLEGRKSITSLGKCREFDMADASSVRLEN